MAKANGLRNLADFRGRLVTFNHVIASRFFWRSNLPFIRSDWPLRDCLPYAGTLRSLCKERSSQWHSQWLWRRAEQLRRLREFTTF